MKKYYHELTVEERKALIGTITYGELFEQYPQPPWCNYCEALRGHMGCWSLMGDKIWKESDCYACDEHTKNGKHGLQHKKFDKWICPDGTLYINTGMFWADKTEFMKHYNDLQENSCISKEDQETIYKMFL